MLEKALEGSTNTGHGCVFWAPWPRWAFSFIFQQFFYGLGLTGLPPRCVLGLYIGQFHLSVGVAARP